MEKAKEKPGTDYSAISADLHQPQQNNFVRLENYIKTGIVRSM